MLNEKCLVYERYENTPGDIVSKLFFYPQWLGRFVCKEDFRIERSDYKSLLLLCTVKGKGELHYRGQRSFLVPGKIAVINCTDPHIYYPVGEWEFKFMHFYGKECDEIYEYMYSLSHQMVFDDNGSLVSKLESVIDMFRNASLKDEIVISKHISDILYSLLFSVQKNRSHPTDEICEYIEQNLSNDLSTDSVAEHFGFSRSYFSTMFKRSSGTSVYEYLLRCRLVKAKSLLSDTNLSVACVAERVGFKDAATFIRAFRHKEGITPLQYRKSFSGE